MTHAQREALAMVLGWWMLPAAITFGLYSYSLTNGWKAFHPPKLYGLQKVTKS